MTVISKETTRMIKKLYKKYPNGIDRLVRVEVAVCYTTKAIYYMHTSCSIAFSSIYYKEDLI